MTRLCVRVLLCASFLAAAVLPSAFSQETIPLRDNWRIQSAAVAKGDGAAISAGAFSPDGWYVAQVPATVLSVLVENGVYPDPYYGDNITRIPGFHEGIQLTMDAASPFFPSWWYRTTFSVPAGWTGKHVVLHLDGINYRAAVWLNGQRVADGDSVVGMFRRFEFDVDDFVVRGGENCLAIEVTGPGHVSGELKNPRTKQIEATTGWDDHNPYPPDMNTGVWQDVYLTATGPVALRHAYVDSRLDVPALAWADLTPSVFLANKTKDAVSGTLKVSLEGTPIALTLPVSLEGGETREVRLTPETHPTLHFERPRVWWPNPLGPQERYTAAFAFEVDGSVSDTAQVRFGIREATSRLEDGWRSYYINGRPILIRGGAWMTSDMMLRLSHKRYEALVRYAREANLNMLRSEGFSIRETEDFYDLCDRYGVMVTQQIFGRNIADEPLAAACIEDMILRIRTHPSLVHFIGHDETYPTETLDKTYQDLIAKYCPDRTYQPNSGDGNDTRWKSGGTRTGNRLLWTYADPQFYYDDPDQYDAYGFAQSGGIGGIIAPYESICRTIPESERWPLWSKSMSLHTVSPMGASYFDVMTQRLEERYGKADSLEEFCTKASVLNYDSARGMFEAWGREKYAAKGITTWKYDAAWPAVLTWQYVDWYLLATGAYYGAKKACEPLHVQYSYDDRSVYVVNAHYQPFSGLKVSAAVLNFDMTEKFSKSVAVDVAADGKTQALVIDFPNDLSTTFFVKLTLHDSAGNLVSENLYWLSTVPDIVAEINDQWRSFSVKMASSADLTALNQLPQVSLDATAALSGDERERTAQVTVKNPSPHLAFSVQLALLKGRDGFEVAPTYWQDNYFCLLPGESKTVSARFAPPDLEGKTPVLRVKAWNAALSTQLLDVQVSENMDSMDAMDGMDGMDGMDLTQKAIRMGVHFVHNVHDVHCLGQLPKFQLLFRGSTGRGLTGSCISSYN